MPNSLTDPRYRQIIDQLRKARLAAELTQTDVATRLNRPQSFIAKVERYERRLDLLEFLLVAAVLGKDPREFFSAWER